MPSWLTRLKDMVWPAILAVVFLTLSVGTAFLTPEKGSQAISLGLAGVTMALLATRV
jgi:hypothetical protein